MDFAFFSFVTLDEATPEDHRQYNMWHQLDHRPENLALPGVAWGDRWARPEEFKQDEPGADPEHADTDYVAMYWFREPLRESLDAWQKLGEDSFQWGRGPLIEGVRRTLLGFFRPVKGYVSASALVSPEVLPFRPNRGLHVSLTKYPSPHSLRTHEHHRFEDRVLIPSLTAIDGVAGAWTFSFERNQQHSTLPLAGHAAARPGSMRIRLLYLEEDPGEVTRRVAERERALRAESELDPEAAQVMFASAVRTITPWQDW